MLKIKRMKGFVILGLAISPFYLAQTAQDTLKIHEIESVNFTKRLPVSKEIINTLKKIWGTKTLVRIYQSC
jgi:iron complex outermembrane receptor protein